MPQEEVCEIVDCFGTRIRPQSSLAFVAWTGTAPAAAAGPEPAGRAPRRMRPCDAVLCPRSVKSACAGSTAPAWGCWRRASPSSTSATSAATRLVRAPAPPLPPRQSRSAALQKLSGVFPSYGFIFHVSSLGKSITIVHQHNHSLPGRTELWLFPGGESAPPYAPVTDFHVGSRGARWTGLCLISRSPGVALWQFRVAGYVRLVLEQMWDLR